MSLDIVPPKPYVYDERSKDPTLVRCMYCLRYFKWDEPACEHLSAGWHDKLRKWRKAQSSASRKDRPAKSEGQDDQGGSPPPQQGNLF